MKKFRISDLLICLFVITGIFLLFILGLSYFYFDREELCFTFYKNNGYVLDSCYKYEDKLKDYDLDLVVSE